MFRGQDIGEVLDVNLFFLYGLVAAFFGYTNNFIVGHFNSTSPTSIRNIHQQSRQKRAMTPCRISN